MAAMATAGTAPMATQNLHLGEPLLPTDARQGDKGIAFPADVGPAAGLQAAKDSPDLEEHVREIETLAHQFDQTREIAGQCGSATSAGVLRWPSRLAAGLYSSILVYKTIPLLLAL